MNAQSAIYFDDAPVLFQELPDGDGEAALGSHITKAVELSGHAPERYRVGLYDGPFPLEGQVLEHSLVKLEESKLEDAAQALGWA